MHYNFKLWLITVSNDANKLITDISNVNVMNNLVISDWGYDLLKMIGYVLFRAVGVVTDYVASCVDEIAKIDFTNIVDLTGYETVLNKISWGVLIIAILVAAGMSLFKPNMDLEYVKWTIVAVFAMACFGEFNTWINGFKNDGVDVLKSTFVTENKKLSEQIFYENSYDMLASIKENELVLINKNIPISGIPYKETMSKRDLQGAFIYDINGVKSMRDLSDGFWNSGFMEERYYKYYIPFTRIIMMCIVVTFMNLLSMAKIAYIGFDWFFAQLYGGLLMSTSVSTPKKIGYAYTAIVKSLISFLFAYAGVHVFRLMTTAIMSANYQFLTKGVLLFLGGLTAILGTGFVAKGFGFDDGTSFILKSMMLTKRMGKMLSKGKNAISKGLDHLSKRGGGEGEGSTGLPDSDNQDVESGNADEQQETPKYIPHSEETDTMYGGQSTDDFYTAPEPMKTYQDGEGQTNFDRYSPLQADEARMSNSSFEPDTDSKSETGLEPKTNKHVEPIDLSNAPHEDVDLGKYKPYSQYKKDYHEKGDGSVTNPNYNSKKYAKNQGMDKELPKWFYDQNSEPTPDYEFNEEKFQQSQDFMRESLEQPSSYEEKLNQILDNPYTSENDRRYYSNLSRQEFDYEYKKYRPATPPIDDDIDIDEFNELEEQATRRKE